VSSVLFFYVFWGAEKTENPDFCAVLGSGKKAVVSLVGIQKYRELFGIGQGCVPSSFKQFHRMLACGAASYICNPGYSCFVF
jgi:hypothetical protein